MTSVCKWLGFYLCMKEPAAVAEKHGLTAGIHGGHYKCDMLITLRESKESSGGLAFDVILKPALLDNPPPVLMRTHSPTKELSQENINKKLKEAEDRRLAMESQKLLSVQKSKERAAEANQRIQDLNDSFMRDAEKRLLEKMEVSMEKKTTQIRHLQERLREHAIRVEMIKKMGEESRADLKERIDRKLETAGEKRELQLGKVQERIRQHQRHIEEVIECSSKFSRDTEERIIQKMENSLKNREDHLNSLLERLKRHAQHAHEIRMNKLNTSQLLEAEMFGYDEEEEDDDEDEDDEEEDRSTEEYQNTQENFPDESATPTETEVARTEGKLSEADDLSVDKDSAASRESSEKGSCDVSDDDDDEEEDDESQNSFGRCLETRLTMKSPTAFDFPSPMRSE